MHGRVGDRDHIVARRKQLRKVERWKAAGALAVATLGVFLFTRWARK
jgi:hypothetical protein